MNDYEYEEIRVERDRLQAENAALQAESVKNILLSIAPGDDGMGVEVFAKSVADVVAELNRISEERDALRAERDALKSDLSKFMKLSDDQIKLIEIIKKHRRRIEKERDALLARIRVHANAHDNGVNI